MNRIAYLILFVAFVAIGVCAKDVDKNLLGTEDHDLEHHKILLGGDDHDLVEHGKPLLGKDNHDKIPHGKTQLGGDDHDMVPHSKPLLGTGDHDMKPHGKPLLGTGDHDMKPHGKPLLGTGDHDMKPHGKPLLGTGDHDMKPHGKPLLGTGDHDMKPHGRPLLGTGDHDMKPHGKSLLGGDDHDLKHHGKQGQEKKYPKKVSAGAHKKKYKKISFGKGDHDKKAHKKPLLGEDDHDKRKHRKPLLGEDDHDKRKHGKALLGGDDHDKKKHRKVLLGEDGHDLKKHGKALLGGDGHDLKKHGKGLAKHGKGKLLHKKKLLGKDSHDKKIHKKRQFKETHDLRKLKMFHIFMKDFKKSYKSEAEYKKRFNIFHENMRKVHILQHNEQGSAKYGPTKFADLTAKEFHKMLGFRPELKHSNLRTQKAKIPSKPAPKSFDWREHGVVTDVKNQGMCGSCWAFSVTGNVEGQWAIKHKTLYSLSEQELVDCDTLDEGCNGGLPDNAYQSIEKLGGLETEAAYPYDGEDEQCHLDESKIKVKVNGSVDIDQDEENIAKWLAENGPVSIGINANALQFYMGGVSHPLKFLCNPEDLDHGMLIVGYGVHTTKYLHRRQPYWIVKNSWGPDWGEEGYYRVYRGDGTCGVNRMASSAIVP